MNAQFGREQCTSKLSYNIVEADTFGFLLKISSSGARAEEERWGVFMKLLEVFAAGVKLYP